jgi:hypothetical protein
MQGQLRRGASLGVWTSTIHRELLTFSEGGHDIAAI